MRTHPEVIGTLGVFYKRSCRDLRYPIGKNQKKKKTTEENFIWDWVQTMGRVFLFSESAVSGDMEPTLKLFSYLISLDCH